MSSLRSLSALVVIVGSFLFGESGASSSSTTCDEAYECEDETISNTYIKCYGYYGCENATMSGTYSYNYGYLSSYESHQSIKYTYSSGLYALLKADLEVYTAHVYGYLAASYAEFSAYSSTLDIILYGYLAGYYADVICSSGNTCNVYCGEVYGCYDLSYYCYSGATCYYDCSDDSSYCPTLYSGVESDVSGLTAISQLKSHETGLTDDEITSRYLTNKATKNRRLATQSPEAEINWDELRHGPQMRQELEQQAFAGGASEGGALRGGRSKLAKTVSAKEMAKDGTTTVVSDALTHMLTGGGITMFVIGVIGTLLIVKLLSVCNKYDNGKVILNHGHYGHGNAGANGVGRVGPNRHNGSEYQSLLA